MLRFLPGIRPRDAESTGFQPADAQRFEFEFALKTMDEGYPRLLPASQSATASGDCGSAPATSGAKGKALNRRKVPLAVLEDAIAEYAAPGCFLPLWTDLWDLQGHDEGHHDLFSNAQRLPRG